ncbi:MAG: succinate dehydrogenase, cytochrome b556 subunit [Gammaproteobacteria bacterium]|nr:succinate dehydrogenase, cytochrome b556 subunit [Gammaproteobacteria bacterium]
MRKNAKRPVYLNLLQIRLPIGGVVSIIHRITGAVMALLIPFALCALQASLESPERFEQVRTSLSAGIGRAAMLLMLWVLIQHLYSGIRHLLMDVDVGVELAPARRSAWLTLAASVTTVVLLGVFL